MAYVIAIVLLLVVIAFIFGVNRLMQGRIADKHGGEPERALDDEREPIPSTHLITDTERPLGDTPGGHDEVNPRDIPPAAPTGRQPPPAGSGRPAPPSRTRRRPTAPARRANRSPAAASPSSSNS